MLERRDKHFPDRPLECGECKKPIAVLYTEIVGDSIIHTSMCADCPELQKRLHGTAPKELIANQTGTHAGLECGTCGTNLEEVKRGHRLGCAECYAVFENILFIELQATKMIPSRLKKGPLHVGRAPGEKGGMSPSSRLLALNEALSETLKREDYEQAASLRDQIKDLTEKIKKKTKDTKDDSSG